MSQSTPRRNSRQRLFVLISAVLVAVFAASVGAGFSATKTDLSNAQVTVQHGDGAVVLNTETERVEAEARALATNGQEMDLVRLADGRTASVNRTTKVVTLLEGGLTTQTTVVGQSSASPLSHDGEVPVVVAAPSAAYLVRPGDDLVELIDPKGRPQPPVSVPGTTSVAVGDGGAGVWVLTDDGRAAHVVGSAVEQTVSAPTPIKHLTVADGRPIGITEAGQALDIAATPMKSVTREPVPHGPTVFVPSPKGAGRYLIVLDRRGTLICVDPRTGQRREFEVPKGVEHNLGTPVVLDDRVYVPDYANQELRSFDLLTSTASTAVKVPGESRKFTVEVQDRRVVANDWKDRRTVTVDPDGHRAVIDKGEIPGVTLSDTERKLGQTPEQPRSSTAPVTPPPGPPTTRTKPAPPPSATTSGTQVPQVTVPAIRSGTAREQACDALDTAGLQCRPVEAGPGGAAGTVRDTSPRGGAKVPRNSTVTVHIYSADLRVPDVIGRRLNAACDSINSVLARPGTDVCAERMAPAAGENWRTLGIVAEQSPKAGEHVTIGTEISVVYTGSVRMPNLLGQAHAGDDACNTIIRESSGQVKCRVVQGSEGGTAGSVASSEPAPGADVPIGREVVLTVFRQATPPPPVPDVRGMSKDQACSKLDIGGWTCDPRPDAVFPDPVVTAQEPAPGTLQRGGSVVVHYSPYEAKPLHRYRKIGDPNVYIIRFAGEEEVGYLHDKYLGRAYPAGAGLTSATASTVRDFMCTASVNACDGVAPNHYYTQDTNTDKPNWTLLRVVGMTLKPVNGQCTDMQSMTKIYRYKTTKASGVEYTVDYEGYVPAARYNELLGCIWKP